MAGVVDLLWWFQKENLEREGGRVRFVSLPMLDCLHHNVDVRIRLDLLLI